MENYYVEPRRLYKGFPTTTTCVFQEHIGKCPVAAPHIHDKIEILYCTEGAYIAVLGGEEHSYKAGDFIIINSREIHETRATTKGINSCWVIQVDPELLYNSTQSIFESRYLMPFTLSSTKHPRVVKYEDYKNSGLETVLNELISENQSKKYGFELISRACVCRLFAWVLRFWNEQGLYKQDERETSENLLQAVQKVLNYINEHYGENISAGDMAKMCNMSYSYFSRQFKRIMAVSFSEYLNSLRISESEKLLSSTNKSITEVAMEVGFSDTSYYIQKFKQMKGVSPGKFKTNYGHKQ